MREQRQILVTHLATGEQTVVLGWSYRGPSSHSSAYHEGAASQLGYRYPSECDCRLVRRGKEYALPFGDVPLVINRGTQVRSVAPAA